MGKLQEVVPGYKERMSGTDEAFFSSMGDFLSKAPHAVCPAFVSLFVQHQRLWDQTFALIGVLLEAASSCRFEFNVTAAT